MKRRYPKSQAISHVFWLSSFFLLSSCYYLQAIQIQGEIWLKQKPLTEVINSPQTNPETKEKLELAQKVLSFCQKELGLSTHGNYEYFSDISRAQVSFLLVAAKKWELEIKQWHYWFVGYLPYRAYLRQSEAEQEAIRLEKEDYDTYIRPVLAYSTLGWFKDPLLSTMIPLSTDEWVETIIHELIHVHIFLKNQGDFNEALASYMGIWGALLFFEKHEAEFKDGYTLVKQLKERLERKKKLAQFLKKTVSELGAWYEQISQQNIRDEPLRKKQFEKLRLECETFGLGMCSHISNNARLLALGTYYSKIEPIESFLKKTPMSFSEFLAFLKQKLLKDKLSPEEIF